MKSSLFSLLFLSFNLIFSLSHADIDFDEQNMGSESIKDIKRPTPYSFQSHLDVVAPCKIKKSHFHKGDKLSFAETDIAIGTIVCFQPDIKEGARVGLAYTLTYLNWHENPYYDQNHFDTLSINLSAFTSRLENWFWRTQFSINMNTQEWSLPFTNYDWLVWGRYEYCKDVGLHFGFWAQTGMRMDRVYPIVGFDWKISEKWMLNVVYPVNISLQYSITDRWYVSLAGRAFDSRQRLKKRSAYHKALIRYQNTGAELLLGYTSANITGNIHVGTTLGGKYRIADSHNHHAENLCLGASAYAGGEVDVSF